MVHRKARCANDVKGTVLTGQVDDIPAFGVDRSAVTLEGAIGEVRSPVDGLITRAAFLVPFGQDEDLKG